MYVDWMDNLRTVYSLGLFIESFVVDVVTAILLGFASVLLLVR